MKKRLLSIILPLALSVSMLGACGGCASSKSDETKPEIKDNPIVTMEIGGYGKIVMELYPNVAPNTVYSFISLVKSGFYDGNTFHRVIPGFVLQGGDPTGTGMGGPGYNIKGEFTDNGFKNNLKHARGVLSMARRADSYDSAGSQFFICLDTEGTSFLDGQYATFGMVIEGMDIVDKIAANEKTSNGIMHKNLTIVKATVDTKGVTYPEPEKIK